MRKRGSPIIGKTIITLWLMVGAILLLAVSAFSEWSAPVNLSEFINPASNETRPALAYAKIPIPIPVHTGKEVFEVGPLPAPLKYANPRLANWKLGYICDRFGIVFADVWTWDCKLVAYDERSRTYMDLPEESRLKLEAQYPMSKAQRGFWNHYGIVVIIVGFMILGALNSARERSGWH